MVREYTWEDILCLILKDMDLDLKDQQYHDLWYLGTFQMPNNTKDKCLRIIKYKMNYRARLKEQMKE